MQVIIRYRYTSGTSYPFVAYTEIAGESIVACGESWESARERLIEKLSAMRSHTYNIPSDETIEI